MQYLRGIESYHDAGKSAVTFGKFDGLHRGHQKLIEKVREFGEKDGIKSVVCAFDMSRILAQNGVQPKLLMTKEERQKHLEQQVDYLVDCPFSEKLSQMSAEDFIRCVIKDIFHADYVVVGTDFRFGHEKHGDIYMLEAYAQKYGYELEVIEKERHEGRIISSTYIKQVLEQGDMPLAEKLLGYPYEMSGVVQHGRKLGRTLGFPTLNVMPEEEKRIPPKGVYLNRLTVDGITYKGIANIGVKPTVTDENRIVIESFLFDFDKEAYGKNVHIELLEFLRPEQKFPNIEAMKQQVNEDIETAKKRAR